MPNNKYPQKGDSKSSMGGSSDRELESQGKNKSSQMGDKSGQKVGSAPHTGTGSDSDMKNDDVTTAGGRKGNFSDKNRGSESQWSPGSSGASDQ